MPSAPYSLKRAPDFPRASPPPTIPPRLNPAGTSRRPSTSSANVCPGASAPFSHLLSHLFFIRWLAAFAFPAWLLHSPPFLPLKHPRQRTTNSPASHLLAAFSPPAVLTHTTFAHGSLPNTGVELSGLLFAPLRPGRVRPTSNLWIFGYSSCPNPSPPHALSGLATEENRSQSKGPARQSGAHPSALPPP